MGWGGVIRSLGQFGGCVILGVGRGELNYLAPLSSENISAPYFKQCFFRGGEGITPQTESNTTPLSPKTEITNILYIEFVAADLLFRLARMRHA